MTMPASPAALLFDWDGTLVDNWPTIHRALSSTLKAWNLPVWTLEETVSRVSASQRDSFPQLFGEEWEKARDHFYAAFEEAHLEELALIDGAESLLDEIAAMGLPVSVVSNKAGRYLRAEAAHLGWSSRFATLVGAGDAPRDKPDRAPVDLALSRMAFEAGPHVWYIGDSGTDVATAHASGCVAVLVEGRAVVEDAVHGPIAIRCGSLSELKRALRRLTR